MLGEQIKHYRLQKKWSQAELATILHVSASAIGMYEQNRRIPDLHIIIAMANLFQITLDEFVGPPFHFIQNDNHHALQSEPVR